jgi:hypothetical protein
MNEIRPWTLDASQVEIIETYEAEIVSEIIERSGRQCYVITFPDTDGSLVEAELTKDSFNTFPHPVKCGTCFGMVVFRLAIMPDTTCAGAWPVSKYWNQSLRTEKSDS